MEVASQDSEPTITSLHIPTGRYSFITQIHDEVARVVRTVRAGLR